MYHIVNKIGIVCDLEGNPLFKSFCYAIADIYQVPKIVRTIPDLVDLDMLFIGDYYYHKGIWTQPGFIEYCNEYNIVVISFIEKDNAVYLNKLKRIVSFYNYTCKIDDRISIEMFLRNNMLI